MFSNHDRPRMLHRLGNDVRKAKLLSMLQLTARGVPFIYYGEEIGMRHAPIPLTRGKDPLAQRNRRVPQPIARLLSQKGLLLNRDECRLPMQWDASPNAGFSSDGAEPWLPVHRDASHVNVAQQTQDPTSIFHTYRGLLALRKGSRALQAGRIELRKQGVHSDVLAYRRIHGSEAVDVLLNASEAAQVVDLGDVQGRSLFSSRVSGLRPAARSYKLEPYEGVLLTSP